MARLRQCPVSTTRGMTQRAMEAEAVRSGMEIGTTRLA
jgi:hypothetical protein